MIKLFAQSVIAALLASDTPKAITLLQDNQTMLQDPLAGANLLAEFLYFSIKKANAKVIQVLLNSAQGIGIDVPFFNYCGNTAIGLALEEGYQEVLPSLLSRTDRQFALMMAVKLHHASTIEFLLKNFAFKEKFLKFLGLKSHHNYSVSRPCEVPAP